MEDWKAAYRLSLFEIRKSLPSFLLSLLLFVFIGYLMAGSLEGYLDNSNAGPDFMFVLLFTIMPAWIKPKGFQIKQINGGIWVPPPTIMLKQLPVKENVLIKSRFIMSYVFSLPFHMVFLLVLYVVSSELQGVLPPGSYVSFSIIWLAFSFYIGAIIPASDAGAVTNTVTITLYGIILLIGCIGVLTFIHMITGQGIVYWTIMAALNWPHLSAVTSIMLGFFGTKYWQHNMRQNMRKMDYL